MKRPMSIQGVGEGSQKCEWTATIPAAVRTAVPPTALSNTTGEPTDIGTRLMKFEAPVVEGSGTDLPGLIGLLSIEGKRGVIETGAPQFMTFPGPGGYKIDWAPGAIHLPLTKAPSGHLCVITDRYDELESQTGGVVAREVSLLSELSELETPISSTPTSSSSTSYRSAGPLARGVAARVSTSGHDHGLPS